MIINKKRLKAKGWSDYEINHVRDIFETAEQIKHPKIKTLDKYLYWILLMIILIGNIVFPIIMLPAIIMLPDKIIFIIAALIGLVFGTLADSLLNMIDHADTKHHLIYVILIPIVAIFIYAAVLAQANQLVDVLEIGYTHNLLIGLVYIVSFMLPYVVIKRIKNEP